MIRTLRRTAMRTWWSAMIRVIMVKATMRRPYSVAPPPAPATVAIGRPVIHVHAAVADDTTTIIIIAVAAIAGRYATTHSDQQHRQ